jgi:pimeloyl-ACP methyl ester carboxylesterase
MVQTIKIGVEDATLFGTIFRPHKDLKKKSAVIIDTGLSLNRWSISSNIAEYLSRKGITAVTYDRRSHNESTGEFKSSKLPEDLDAIIRYLWKEQKKTKVGLLGFCFGGIPAIYSAAHNKNVKALVLLNSYPEYGHMERRSSQLNLRRIRYLLAWAAYKSGIYKMLSDKIREHQVIKLDKGTGLHYRPRHFIPELINGLDARPVLKEVKIPTLIIQGTDDRMVDPRIADEMLSSCGAKDKEAYKVQDGHFLRKKRDEAAEKAAQFFLQHI